MRDSWYTEQLWWMTRCSPQTGLASGWPLVIFSSQGACSYRQPKPHLQAEATLRAIHGRAYGSRNGPPGSYLSSKHLGHHCSCLHLTQPHCCSVSSCAQELTLQGTVRSPTATSIHSGQPSREPVCRHQASISCSLLTPGLHSILILIPALWRGGAGGGEQHRKEKTASGICSCCPGRYDPSSDLPEQDNHLNQPGLDVCLHHGDIFCAEITLSWSYSGERRGKHNK